MTKYKGKNELSNMKIELHQEQTVSNGAETEQKYNRKELKEQEITYLSNWISRIRVTSGKKNSKSTHLKEDQ